MRYVSLTDGDKEAMLARIGVDRVSDLFRSIPQGARLKAPLEIPEAAAETTLLDYFEGLAQENARAGQLEYFLGAGAYHHFIPSVIETIISRAEFYTAYTPYQPEISQGTLQAIFEFQTLVCQLTGMEVANASLYDGSTSLAEAVLMAVRITGRRRVLLPVSLHPHYRQVLKTYISRLGIGIDEVPLLETGQLDLERLESALGSQHAAVVLQSPNFFGVIEELGEVSRIAHAGGALSIAVLTEALSLGLLRPPGDLGADIVAAEGQSLGIPLSFGGPYLGLLATRDAFRRQIPGRLVGQTVDRQGRRGFVLTLSTREQHIRRERATSNICTNQGLVALVAAIFMSTLGRQGIRQMAAQNLKKSFYLRRQLEPFLVFSGPVFNEFTVRCNRDPVLLNRLLLEEGIVGGLPLGRYFPDRKDQMLLCTTEQNRAPAMDRLALFLREGGVEG